MNGLDDAQDPPPVTVSLRFRVRITEIAPTILEPKSAADKEKITAFEVTFRTVLKRDDFGILVGLEQAGHELDVQTVPADGQSGR